MLPDMSALAVDNASGATNLNHANGTNRGRWRLNRAGIINVYQYENEVLDFAGGRLLLRGVNGSGKSTAMNMLLPFLLTARPGRIDAAGEQTGILKSWMLSGRDDAQPVGYLWIEFERRGEHLVCGCGIKANRQSDTVTTWWFVTSKRPGLDVRLVVGNQPLSADGLRAALDGDEVFSGRRRSDYRHAVQQRLFGGVPIDQHIGLIHVVRSPRVGDRIDVELPEHLVEALPQLSEQALAEAAQPLDDLEEHRRNVADLERTSEAIDGLLDVYRAYCADELRGRTAEARSRLSAERGRTRNEKQKQRAAKAAEAEVVRLDEAIAEEERTAERLRSEISALEESRAYREGRQLDALRDFVKNLATERERASGRVAWREERLEAATGELLKAQQRSRSDVAALNVGMAAAAELSELCRVGRRPPGLIDLAEAALTDAGASEPVSPFDDAVISREIAAMSGAVLARQADIDQVDQARTELDAAENALSLAESRFEAASDAADHASARLAEQDQHLAAARRQWHDSIRLWASEVCALLQSAGLDTAAASVAAAVEATDSESDASSLAGDGRGTDVAPDRAETLRDELSSACDELIGRWRESAAAVGYRLDGERVAAREAQALVDALADRTEPEPPRLGWQTDVGYCLADLIDFKAHLTEVERSGLEAALESSGLLSARLIEGGVLELASGELVVATADPVVNPLSDCLAVTVPDRLNDRVETASVVRLLRSISSDSASDAATAAATDGSFRVGALHGRHSKDRPEFIGTTARREALERERQEASVLLVSALAVVRDSEAELAEHRSSLKQAQRLQGRLPSTSAILSAAADVAAAGRAADEASAGREAAAADRDDAERAATGASNEPHGQVPDHVLVDPELALELLDRRARPVDVKHEVVALPVLPHPVRQPPQPPVLAPGDAGALLAQDLLVVFAEPLGVAAADFLPRDQYRFVIGHPPTTGHAPRPQERSRKRVHRPPRGRGPTIDRAAAAGKPGSARRAGPADRRLSPPRSRIRPAPGPPPGTTGTGTTGTGRPHRHRRGGGGRGRRGPVGGARRLALRPAVPRPPRDRAAAAPADRAAPAAVRRPREAAGRARHDPARRAELPVVAALARAADRPRLGAPDRVVVVVRPHQRMRDLVEDRVVELRPARRAHVQPGEHHALLREIAGPRPGPRLVEPRDPAGGAEAVALEELAAAPEGAVLDGRVVRGRTARPEAPVGHPVLLAGLAADRGGGPSERHDAPGDLEVPV